MRSEREEVKSAGAFPSPALSAFICVYLRFLFFSAAQLTAVLLSLPAPRRR